MNGDIVIMIGDKSNRKINEKFEVFVEDKLMRWIKESRKNSIPNIHRGEDFHISEPEILEFKILGEGSYQILPENLNNPENFGEGSYQISPENSNNPEIAEESFHTFFLNSVDCKEVNN